ncbi:MAG: HPr family phosphocarrier protein [Clostridiales bacterium]|nr:HPr family phosphocarrier protein [Clostridiales bacterium]
MTEDKVIFNCNTADLQMKAVAMLVQKASDFRSTIYLVRNGHRANAKSLLGVMSLGIENGAEITITADGTDSGEAVKTLIEYLKDPKV